METNANPTLSAKVEKFKLIARDSLRMQLIAPRLTRIAALESEKAEVQKTLATLAHDLKVATYEVSKLDEKHPNFEKTKAAKDETIKFINEKVEAQTKYLAEVVEKAITEQKEGITKIENGETKVSLDCLNDLVSTMIRQDALNQVSA